MCVIKIAKAFWYYVAVAEEESHILLITLDPAH